MKKLAYSLLFCLSIGFLGCTEPISTFSAEIFNKSSTDIKLLPYRNGIVGSKDTLYISSGKSLSISEGWHRGALSIPFFESEMIAIGLNDSLVIIFNDDYSVPHFWEDPEIIPEKGHLYSDPRNVVNRENYEFISKGSKRSGYNNIHNYTFTEADYEYAKE